MTDLLSIGASGIRAYSRALGTVSDNIANAQTPGYARRGVRIEEVPTGSNSPFYRASVQPGGVLIDGVTRSVDAWLIDDARISGSDQGRTTARLGWVEAAERALEDGTNGVGARLTGVFNAADALSADPASQPLRGGFLIAVDDAASALRSTATNLASTASGIADDAATSVNAFNSNLGALSRVNDGLLRARDGSVNQASLLDERDRLIDALAATAAVTPSFGARGDVALRLSGVGGEALLSGPTLSPLSLGVGANGQIGYSIGGSPVAPLSGKLAGLAEAAAQVATRRGALDTLSNQFAAHINAAHQSGRDQSGNPGGPLINAGGGAATIAAIALAPGAVAAASDTSPNGNILGLAALRGGDGVEAGWAGLISLHAQSTASARAQDAAATTRRDGAFAARDAVSAVDLDHEAAELLRFQQAYEGAARTIQIARETMQSILNIF